MREVGWNLMNSGSVLKAVIGKKKFQHAVSMQNMHALDEWDQLIHNVQCTGIDGELETESGWTTCHCQMTQSPIMSHSVPWNKICFSLVSINSAV